jgi:hypothetical protein
VKVTAPETPTWRRSARAEVNDVKFVALAAADGLIV